jgi:integrase/recombinase XerC
MLPGAHPAPRVTLPRGAKDMRLETAREKFIAYKRQGDSDTGQRACAPATLRVYAWHLRQFIDWMAVETGRHGLITFTAERARAYLAHRAERRDLSPSTLALDSMALREFAKWGEDQGYWLKSDVRGIPHLASPKRLPRPYTASERDALMDLELGPADRVLRSLLYYAGLRRSEVIAVRLRDVTPPHPLPTGETIPGRLYVWGKGSKERSVDLHAALWREIEAYLRTLPPATRADRHLLAKGDGTPWTAGMVQRRMRAWGKTAGVVNPQAHRYRHTFATDVLEASPGEILTVQALLGHASVSTTQVYTKLSDARKARAVAALPDLTRRHDYVSQAPEAAEMPPNLAENKLGP